MAASKNTKRKKSLYVVLFAAYLILLFYFLFFSEGLGRASTEAEYRYNLTLFREIKRFIEYRHVLGYKAVFLNVVGNVIAFMPFGFLLPPLMNYKTNWFVTTIWAFLFSLFVETIQLFFRLGSFDVDDMLLNTIGGLLGYIICILLKGTKGKKRD
ncbi:MAG: VanZ family protein [Lachnospiraceae bacterium]|nr:VanZ family protein [Lachnospiraceae bacterium]MDD7334688.1 VanZ family protein [Lachnospiraceae bacterium]MDY5520637.1 VanZ family protein [Agathobacter sp.]